MRFFALERMWEIASLHSSLCTISITQAGCFSNPIFMHLGKNRKEIVSPSAILRSDFPEGSFPGNIVGIDHLWSFAMEYLTHTAVITVGLAAKSRLNIILPFLLG